jgi:hypothetical protein
VDDEECTSEMVLIGVLCSSAGASDVLSLTLIFLFFWDSVIPSIRLIVLFVKVALVKTLFNRSLASQMLSLQFPTLTGVCPFLAA